MDRDVPTSEISNVIHCGNLSVKTTHPELVNLFSQVAPVIKIRLTKPEKSPKAFAFVTMECEEDAKKVIEKFNYYTLHDKQMLITPVSTTPKALPEANIFVKNLPPTLTSKDLNMIFKAFGNIISCKVSTDEKGESKGYGFVQYSTAKAANKAIQTCQNAKISGYVLEVMLYEKPAAKEAKPVEEPAALTFTNCFVKNFPADMKEDDLKEILEAVGPVNSIYFPVDKFTGNSGFACVNFVNPNDAVIAIEKLHEKLSFDTDKYKSIPSAPFYIQKSEKKSVREQQIKRQIEQLSLQGTQPKNNLYLSNIPDTFTEKEVEEQFGKYGEITSMQIRKSTNPSGKKYGYVCFRTAEEAAEAYEKLAGFTFDHTKLEISYYKNKHERLTEEPKMKKSFAARDQENTRGNTKLVQTLVKTVEKMAPIYKSAWKTIGATNPADFSHKIAREFILLPDSEVKEMIGSCEILDKKIISILAAKGKGSTKSIENF